MPTSLLMQFQRQSVRVMEESHLLSGIIVNPNRLTFNTDFCQLIHRLLHAINAERKMTQTTGLRPVYTLRRICLSENLQLCVNNPGSFCSQYITISSSFTDAFLPSLLNNTSIRQSSHRLCYRRCLITGMYPSEAIIVASLCLSKR